MIPLPLGQDRLRGRTADRKADEQRGSCPMLDDEVTEIPLPTQQAGVSTNVKDLWLPKK